MWWSMMGFGAFDTVDAVVNSQKMSVTKSITKLSQLLKSQSLKSEGSGQGVWVCAKRVGDSSYSSRVSSSINETQVETSPLR